MSKERNVAKYHLTKDRKVVHRGITERSLHLREIEHQEKFPGSLITKIGRRTTKEKALEWERGGGER